MIDVRRILTHVEDIHHEFGPPPAQPLRIELAQKLRAAMDVSVERIETYGKGAIVGAAGELEHGALWHVPGGYAMRELLGQAKAIVPSSKKVGPMGARL